MAQKKKHTKTASTQSIFDLLQENLPSLVIGFFIFILFVIGVTNFLTNYKSNHVSKTQTNVNISHSPSNVIKTNEKTANTKTQNSQNTQYTIQDGDNLSEISMKFYNTDTNIMIIAQANNISNPDMINAGQKITIPKIKTQLTIAQNNQGQILTGAQTTRVTVQADKYTIQPGDSLWTIAVQAYGDGFMWTKIAQANNITNPDVINQGNVLVIPRSQGTNST